MSKSSIHVRGVGPSSERHNKREMDLNYVRKDLSHLNSSFEVKSIAQAKAEISEKYKATTGQKMQDKAKPIREAVLLIENWHNSIVLQNLAQKIEKRFGIRTIQGYCHKDEGHYDVITSEWKPNYHAHLVFDWTNEKTGKAIRMDKEDMSELQTIVAKELKMERGVKSSKKHIESTQFKAIKEEEDLQKIFEVKNTLPVALKMIERCKDMEKQEESLKSEKNNLKIEVLALKKEKEQLEKEINKKNGLGLIEFGKDLRRMAKDIFDKNEEDKDKDKQRSNEEERVHLQKVWNEVKGVYEKEVEHERDRLKHKERKELEKQLEWQKIGKDEQERRERELFKKTVSIPNSIVNYLTDSDVDSLRKTKHLCRKIWANVVGGISVRYVSLDNENVVRTCSESEVSIPSTVNGRVLTERERQILIEGQPLLLNDLKMIVVVDASTKNLSAITNYDETFVEMVKHRNSTFSKVESQYLKNLVSDKKQESHEQEPVKNRGIRR